LPSISADPGCNLLGTSILHHAKHRQACVTALNTAKANYVKASTPKERIAFQAVIRFNGGGRINHSLFGTNLAPSAAKGNGHGGVLKEGPLKAAIGAAFGSPNALKK